MDLAKFQRYFPTCLMMYIAVIFVGSSVMMSHANAETRTLKLYYTHTKESATVTFKKNGRYVSSGLKKLNRLLRDFRRNEPTKMDPALFDLVWEVYQKSGSRKPIQVISGYRSPRTNNMLRRRGRKVARNSQHTKGKALDFFLPDVHVSKLRALGLKAHGGGVGYYRGSFVHLDTGRVRHWPRMSRKQLARVFPKGRTIHVPSDGKPLKGYKVAAANLKKGLNSDGSSRRTKASASLLAGLFKKSGNDGDENEGNVKVAAAKAKPAAKAKTATPAKKSGSDPFALEVAAAKKVKKEEVVKTELEAEAKEPVIEVAENTVTIPKRRPQLVAEATPQIVEVPVPDTENTGQKLEEAEKATQLALAETQPQPKVRPATGDETEQSQQLAAQKRTAGDVVALEALKSRIRTALARQRELSSAEKAVQAQANAELIERVALLRKPKVRPEADTITASSNLGGVDSNQPLGLNGELVQVPTPQWRTDEKSKPTDQSSQIAKLKEKIDAALQARTSQPSAQEVPVPNMVGELKLGDLDGRNVRKWAVALSTRVGPIATLSAPRYGQGTRRAAPVSVYSAGFANNRPPLRADRFSGRALTRVAFAYFTNN